MIRFLFLIIVVGFLTGCSIENSGGPRFVLTPKESYGYKMLFQYFSARNNEAAGDQLLFSTRFRSSDYHTYLYCNDYYQTLSKFYRSSAKLNKILYENVEGKFVAERDSMKYYLDRILGMKMPLSVYTKLLEIDYRLKEIKFGRIINEKGFKQIRKLNMLIYDFSRKFKSDCSASIYSYTRTGNIIKVEFEKDKIGFFHSTYTSISQNVKLNYYNIDGELLSTKRLNNADSIVLESNPMVSICEIVYLNKDSFCDYVDLGNYNRSTLLTIRANRYNKLNLNEWMENKVLFSLCDQKNRESLNFSGLYENLNKLNFDSNNKYRFQDLKASVNYVFSTIFDEKHNKPNLFDAYWKEFKEYKEFIFWIESIENKNFNNLSYFVGLMNTFHQFYVSNGFCFNWGDPSLNDHFGVYKIHKGDFIYFTGGVLVFSRIPETRDYKLEEWKKEFRKLNFPIEGNLRRLDGGLVKTDSIRRENLLYYSTN